MNREQMIEKAAQALANVENGGNVEQSDRDVSAVILDAILPQVTTVAELEALPLGSVLFTTHGQPLVARRRTGNRNPTDYGVVSWSWVRSGVSLTNAESQRSIGFSAFDWTNEGPLTVVWQPEAKS